MFPSLEKKLDLVILLLSEKRMCPVKFISLLLAPDSGLVVVIVVSSF